MNVGQEQFDGMEGALTQALPMQLKRLLAELLQRWEKGRLGDDTGRIPAERNLAEEYGVARGTLRRALEVLEEAGYIGRIPGKKCRYVLREPSATSKKSQTRVALLISRYGELRKTSILDVFSRLDLGAADRLQSSGWHTLHYVWRRDESLQEQWSHWKPQGCIVGAEVERYDDLRNTVLGLQRQGAHVVVNSDDPCWQETPRVVVDFYQGCKELTTWLIRERCARRILFMNHRHVRQRYWMQARYEGFLAAMQGMGLTPASPLVVDERVPDRILNDRENFRRRVSAMMQLLAPRLAEEPFDAILGISDSDIFVIGEVLRELEQATTGIVGWDDYWRSCAELEWTGIRPWATMNNRMYEVGQKMAEMLLSGDREPRKELIVPQLITVC